MHELSIATSIVEIARGHAWAAGGGRILAVTLRVGRLASVHEAALRSAFEIATIETPLAGAELRVIVVPVTIFCALCAAEKELAGIGSLACPTCGRPSGDIRTGTELEVDSIEIEPVENATA
jgi:hydrogenase nickel incorporation protein HypA/HybF